MGNEASEQEDHPRQRHAAESLVAARTHLTVAILATELLRRTEPSMDALRRARLYDYLEQAHESLRDVIRRLEASHEEEIDTR
jgi:hypothetical protein